MFTTDRLGTGKVVVTASRHVRLFVTSTSVVTGSYRLRWVRLGCHRGRTGVVVCRRQVVTGDRLYVCCCCSYVCQAVPSVVRLLRLGYRVTVGSTVFPQASTRRLSGTVVCRLPLYVRYVYRSGVVGRRHVRRCMMYVWALLLLYKAG